MRARVISSEADEGSVVTLAIGGIQIAATDHLGYGASSSRMESLDAPFPAVGVRQQWKLPAASSPAVRSLLMRHSITLNVRYDQSQANWDRVVEVYRSMPGWRGGSDASWFGGEGDQEWMWASVEPSGILIEAEMADAAWSKWIGELCARLTAALGQPVREADS